MAQDDGRSVAGDFDDIVGGVGVRLGEVGDDDFVNSGGALLRGTTAGGRLSVVRGGFHEFAEDSASRLQIVLQTEHSKSDGAGIRPGEAHDTEAAAAGWRGYGHDRVVEIHGNSFEFLAPGCKRRGRSPSWNG